MSVIAIIIEKSQVPASTLMKLHQITGAPLTQLKTAVMAHEPVLELEIFEGNYQERAQLIRAVCDLLKTEKVDASYYEIPYGQQCVGNPQLSLWKIDLNLVEGILDAADDEIERQLNS